MAVDVRDRAARFREAAAAHERAADRHGVAISYWAAAGDQERAALERRSVEVAHQAAQIEWAKAALEERRPAT